MLCNAIRPGEIVVHGARSGEYDTHKFARGALPGWAPLRDGPLERERIGGDDVNAGIRAIRQVVLGPTRSDPTNVKRS
jgi:hypothetical protein